MSETQDATILLEGPLPAEAFADPLGLILAAHARQRQLCDQFDALVNEHKIEAVAPLAQQLLDFINGDLARHTEDEERNLFPLLRQRCLPEDGIEHVLDQLSAEHELDQDLVDFMIEDLKTLGGRPHPAQPDPLLDERQGIHRDPAPASLRGRNRTVLPLAHRRLTADDLTALGRAMAERRGQSLA